MSQTIWSVVFVFLLFSICAGIGARICRRLGLPPSPCSLPDRYLFAMAVGIGVVSISVLIIGLLGGLRPAVLFPLIACAAAVCWRDCVRAARSAATMVMAPLRLALDLLRGPGQFIGIWLTLALLIAGAASFFTLSGALAPPADSAYDTLTYHFGVPALYLRWGQIRYDPYILHSNFPQTTEMLYLLGLAAHIRGAQAIHFAFGLLAAAVCWSLARPYGRLAAAVGMMVFWTCPVVAWEASVGYDDLSFAFFQALAFLACIRLDENLSDRADHHNSVAGMAGRWSILAGLCQGLALAVKYSAAAFIPLIALLLLFVCRRHAGQWKHAFLWVAQAAGGALVSAGPWYLRTTLWTGSPVFPYFYNLFGGRNWSMAAARAYRSLQLGYGTGHSPLDFMVVPWRLLTLPVRYYEPAGHAAFGSIFGSIGPLPLMLIGMAIVLGRGRRNALILSGLFVLFLGEWYLLMQQVRYLIEAIPLIAPLCGLALAQEPQAGHGASQTPEPAGPVGRQSRRRSKNSSAAIPMDLPQIVACVGFLAAVSWLCYWMHGLYASPGPGSDSPSALQMDLGQATRADYLSARLGDLWPVSEWIKHETPPDARVALIAEPRGYYMDRETLWADGYEQGRLNYSAMRSPGDLAEALREQKIGYVVIRLGTSLGLVAGYGHLPAKHEPATWSNLDLTRPDAHWISLYAGAIRQGMLVQVYPDASVAATDSGGYVAYRVSTVGIHATGEPTGLRS